MLTVVAVWLDILFHYCLTGVCSAITVSYLLSCVVWRCRSATQLSFMSRAGSYQLQQQPPGGTFPKSKSPVTKDKGKRREQQMSANVLNDS